MFAVVHAYIDGFLIVDRYFQLLVSFFTEYQYLLISCVNLIAALLIAFPKKLSCALGMDVDLPYQGGLHIPYFSMYRNYLTAFLPFFVSRQ